MGALKETVRRDFDRPEGGYFWISRYKFLFFNLDRECFKKVRKVLRRLLPKSI
jgi:hypothetical protein